jgi:endonuclease/exonuclease/phosphatase family metal-dependent hydrolase
MIYYITSFFFTWILLFWFLSQKTVKETIIPIKENYQIKQKKITILTFNIQKFPWSIKNFEEIKNLIQFHDIILLQECYDITSIEKDFPDFYISRGTLKGFNLIHSGLVILSTFPILETEFIPYQSSNSLTFDRFTEKGILSILIRVGYENIRIMNTHLQSSDYQRYDHCAFLQFNELLEYTKGIKESYIIGGDFNIDIHDMKVFHNLPFYYPTDPTIYIDFKTGNSQSYPGKTYEGMIFDYFITKGLEIKTMTIKSMYSDHNPVSSIII